MPQSIEVPKEKWTGKVREVTLGATAAEGGTRARTVTVGVTASFLKEEYRRAMASEETVDCRDEGCNVCGLQGRDPLCREKAAARRA